MNIFNSSIEHAFQQSHHGQSEYSMSIIQCQCQRLFQKWRHIFQFNHCNYTIIKILLTWSNSFPCSGQYLKNQNTWETVCRGWIATVENERKQYIFTCFGCILFWMHLLMYILHFALCTLHFDASNCYVFFWKQNFCNANLMEKICLWHGQKKIFWKDYFMPEKTCFRRKK